jgi:predicted RNase H-like nuclease (RuvC/YqgF family)
VQAKALDSMTRTKEDYQYENEELRRNLAEKTDEIGHLYDEIIEIKRLLNNGD